MADKAQFLLQLGKEASLLSKFGHQALGTIASTNARFGGVLKQGPRRSKRVDSQEDNQEANKVILKFT